MKYTADVLASMLDAHMKWLRGEEGGKRFVLEEGADLRSADLRSADLRYANLRYANLRYANLRYANLRYTDLRYADLTSADLRYANLRYTDLRYANLRYTDLRYADLTSADLRYAEEFDPLTAPGFHFAVCPSEGAFIGYKRVNSPQGKAVLVLQIPAKAKRVSTYRSRKCRANTVKVLRAETIEGQPHPANIFTSTHDISFTYEVGKTLTVPDYDGDVHEECTKGIHFFITRKEAAEY